MIKIIATTEDLEERNEILAILEEDYARTEAAEYDVSRTTVPSSTTTTSGVQRQRHYRSCTASTTRISINDKCCSNWHHANESVANESQHIA
ncbi:hypothetical protein RI054_43g151790 [Pseudoscourfieldia marina]